MNVKSLHFSLNTSPPWLDGKGATVKWVTSHDLPFGPYPCFVDIEASSLGDNSYPIAVAWNLPDGEIRRYLISPSYAAGWDDWDPEAEAIHQLDRDRLYANGWPPDFVAEQFSHDLGCGPAASDAPDFDNPWLTRLFEQAGQKPPFTLGHSDDLFIAILRKPSEMIYEAVLRLDGLKQRANRLRRDRHDAGADVGWLLRLWELAHGAPERYNHGIGPMPKVTETGSFVALKGRVVNKSDARASPDSGPNQ